MEPYIDPKTLARVKDMPLVAKTVAEGFLHGHHQSIQRGVGIEFSQYRPYEEGDDLSRIDWKLFARSDRYYVREAERESEMSIWFILDASASMSVKSLTDKAKLTFGKNKAKGKTNEAESWSKLEYAKHVVATLSYLASKQGDQFGLLSLASDQCHNHPLGSSERHWANLLRTLTTFQAGNLFPSLSFLQSSIAQLQKPNMIFVISDFFQENNEIIDFISKIAITKNEVFALQLECNDEVNFPYSGAVRLEDAETSEQILVSASQAKTLYQTNRIEQQKVLSNTLNRLGVPFSTANIDAPLDQTIVDFLKNRARILS